MLRCLLEQLLTLVNASLWRICIAAELSRAKLREIDKELANA
jgi:hypothetical protein